VQVILKKENDGWRIDIEFDQLSSKQEKLICSVEILSFVQQSPALTEDAIDLISSEYGIDLAEEAIEVLSKAMMLTSFSDKELKTKDSMSTPVIDGVFIDQK
jgi:hypothetical protein